MEFADNCSNNHNTIIETVEKSSSNSNNNNYQNYTHSVAIQHNSDMEGELITAIQQIKVIVDESESLKCEQMETESENIQIYAAAEGEDEAKGGGECVTQQHPTGMEISRFEEEQIITEIVDDASVRGVCTKAEQSNGMRVAVGIILRFMLPIANGVMRSFKGVRDARLMRALKSITSSRQALTNLMAFVANTISMNLSAVQVSQRVEPIMKILKLRKSPNGIESLPDTTSVSGVSFFSASIPSTPTSSSPDTTNALFPPNGFPTFVREPTNVIPVFCATNQRKTMTLPPQPAPNCCSVKILAEPPPGQPIRADIVFIHGLHGSLTKTWRQGLWANERQPVSFERPPKPPVRPPKRPKHSRNIVLRPPHKEKRARFAYNEANQRYTQGNMEREEGNDLDDGFFDATEKELRNSSAYFCGYPENIQSCDGIEYSFPTFRLRLHDNGRLVEGEFETFTNQNTNDNETDEAVKTSSHPPNNNTKRSPKGKLSTSDPSYSNCWPSDWLPLDCPGVRVIAVNYTTDEYLWRPLWMKKQPRSSLIERAREMTDLLIKHRVGYGQPIVWVGHSKGGLFIKQIIVDAWESGRPAVAPLWRSARGVFFYSVPHRGSDLACIKAPLLARSIEMLDIEKNNKYLLDLHQRFAGLYYMGHIKIEVFSFVETALTLMSVLYLRIVGADSADPGFGDVCGIRLDHREICKPRSRDCILYKELVKMIKKVC